MPENDRLKSGININEVIANYDMEVFKIYAARHSQELNINLFLRVCRAGFAEAVNRMLPLFDKEYLNERQALFVAAGGKNTGRAETIEALVNGGLDVNYCIYPNTSNATTTLGLAAVRRDTAMVGILLDNGANIDDSGERGITPLLRAVWAGREANARLLIARKASQTAGDGGIEAFNQALLKHCPSLYKELRGAPPATVPVEVEFSAAIGRRRGRPTSSLATPQRSG